jgi:hypothetical protein
MIVESTNGLYDYLKKQLQKPYQHPFQKNKQYQSDFNTFYWVDDQKTIGTLAYFFGRITTKGKIPIFDYLEIINDYQYIFSKIVI